MCHTDESCTQGVTLTKVVHFKMVVRRVNMCYLMREAVELVQNEGSDLEGFFLTVVLKRTLLILARSLCQ